MGTRYWAFSPFLHLLPVLFLLTFLCCFFLSVALSAPLPFPPLTRLRASALLLRPLREAMGGGRAGGTFEENETHTHTHSQCPSTEQEQKHENSTALLPLFLFGCFTPLSCLLPWGPLSPPPCLRVCVRVRSRSVSVPCLVSKCAVSFVVVHLLWLFKVIDVDAVTGPSSLASLSFWGRGNSLLISLLHVKEKEKKT